VESYEEKIDHLREESMSGNADRITLALDLAIELLDEINDERESTWQMLEEIKASDVKNHKKAQMETIDGALLRAKSLMMTKVGKA
jgi:hypothetical protein|tara:strand:- start:84 stop:341 length:258 start_codon:yes stop_codon:yes gene_type:complete